MPTPNSPPMPNQKPLPSDIGADDCHQLDNSLFGTDVDMNLNHRAVDEDSDSGVSDDMIREDNGEQKTREPIAADFTDYDESKEPDKSATTRKYMNVDVLEENKIYSQSSKEAHNIDRMISEADKAASEEQDNRSFSTGPKERRCIHMNAETLSSDGAESEEPDKYQEKRDEPVESVTKRKPTKKPS